VDRATDEPPQHPSEPWAAMKQRQLNKYD